ncbi:hypothetical protein J6590_081598 [Homalodisca vitripennis]|nr:hypothetical protein J6590_081598 [Homalodisca vitripennis]
MLGSPGSVPVMFQVLMCASHCRWSPSRVLSDASYFGPWSGSAAWMQESDSALPLGKTPSTYGILCVSVLGKRRFGPRGTGVGASSLLQEEDLQGSLTLTTGTPTRGLKTSPPPAPFKAVSDTGSSSGSRKRKEEVDLAMEMTKPETPQTKKERIPPRKSPLRGAFGLQMLRQQQDDASKEEDLSLKKMIVLLKEMGKALLTQRNCYKVIKDGIRKLDDFLGGIEEFHKTRLKMVKQERAVINRVISDSPQGQAHLDETQARKRAKRRRSSSP